MKRITAPLFIAAGLLAGAAILHAHRDGAAGSGVRAPSNGATAVAMAEAAAFRFRFPEDRVLLYDLEYTSRQSHGLGGLGAAAGEGTAADARLEGEARVVGRMHLQGLGREGTRHRVHLGFAAPGAVTATLQGRPLLGTPSEAVALLAAHDVELLLEEDGALVELRFAADAPTPYRHLLRHLVAALGVEVPPGVPAARFERTETTDLGVFDAQYTLAAAPSTYDRTRTIRSLLRAPGEAGPPQFAHTARIELNPAGYVQTLDVDESLSVSLTDGTSLLSSVSRTRLALLASRAADRRTPEAGRIAETLAAPRFSDDAARRALEAQAGSLTGPALLAELDAFALRGAGPEHRAFLWQAVGRLRLEPALCAALADRFTADSTGTQERALLADLLAATGTAEAQAALRTALSSDAARADAEAAPALWQRLSLVGHPDADTLALAVRGADAAGEDPVQRQATAYALGAVAGARLNGHPDDAVAGAALERLRTAFDEAATAEDRKHAARALQNARHPADLERFVALAEDPDAAVRLAAVDALAQRPEAAATAALVARLGDAAGPVQARTLAALAGRADRASAVPELLALARRGGLGAEALPAATAFVERGGFDAETSVLLADAILSHHPVPASLRGRLRRTVEG